jgi:inverted formin-2
MKQLTWSKIPPQRIIGKQNLWTKFYSLSREPLVYDEYSSSRESIQYFNAIEDYFKTSDNPNAEATRKDPNLKEHKMWTSNEKINLLDNKRSLNINIFLKQLR